MFLRAHTSFLCLAEFFILLTSGAWQVATVHCHRFCAKLGRVQTKGDCMAVTEERLSKATILGMIAMGVAVLVVANDFTALSVALPAIEKTLHTDITTVQWVI